MNAAALIKAAAKMPPVRARQVLALAAAQGDSRHEETPAIHEARAAFERGLQPVCGAIVGALQAGDLDALHGLRGLLPHLLAEVNESPALAEVLAHQLGKSLLVGLNAAPEDVL